MKTQAISKLAMRALACAFVALGTLACTQEQEVPIPSPDPVPGVGKESFTPQRTEAQAKQIALAFLREQGGAFRVLSSSFAFETSVMTRSSARSLDAKALDSVADPVDTLLYVLNLRDQQGSVLVAGDKRLPDIVGYLPQGHLDLKNLPEHSGISLFLESYPKYYGARLRSLPKPYAPIWATGEMEYHYEYFKEVVKEGSWEEICKPLCPVTWHQVAPYNFRAPFVSEEDQALAGCTAVATAQLMASHKYPYYLKGKVLHWDLLCRYPTPRDIDSVKEGVSGIIDYLDQVSYLLRYTGNLLGNSWGKDGTGAYTWNIPNILRGMGYTQTPQETAFSVSGIIASLDRGSSVIMSGFDQRVGHAWLCDGYKRRVRIVRPGYNVYGEEVFHYRGKKVEANPRHEVKREEYTVYEAEREETEYLLHYNWGWGESKKDPGYRTFDGYFTPDVFKPGNGYDFSRNVRNILDIRP